MRLSYLLPAALIGVLLVIPSARADCRRVVTNPYQAQAYHAPYVAPAYNQDIVLVPTVLQVEVSRQFVFGVGDEYRQLAFARQVAQEYAKIQQPGNAGYGSSVPAAAPPLAAPVTPPPAAAPLPVTQAPAGQAFVTGLPQGFREVVQAKCQTCHSAGGKGYRKLDLSSLDQLAHLTLPLRNRMFRSVANSSMPMGVKLTDAELSLFDQYSQLAEVATYGAPAPVAPPPPVAPVTPAPTPMIAPVK